MPGQDGSDGLQPTLKLCPALPIKAYAPLTLLEEYIMVASTTALSQTPNSAHSLNAAPSAKDPITEAQKTAQARPEGQRNTLNAQILEASLQVSVQAGNNGLALLYRSAIDSINAYLEPELGPDAIGQAMGQDNSPEATAGRILSMSTAFFEAYAAQHADEDPETVVRNFVELIRGGFEQGYREAEDILNGLGVLGEGSPVAEGIQKTYALVQQGYDDFLARKLEALRAPATTAPETTPEAGTDAKTA